MTFHAMTERYEEITVCRKPALFTSIRIHLFPSFKIRYINCINIHIFQTSLNAQF